MISIIALVVGLAGMVVFWALAWQFWTAAQATEGSPDTDIPSVAIDEVPVARAHTVSNASTAFFSRPAASQRVEAHVEKTAILHDEQVPAEPRSRKTRFYPGPPPPGAR